MTNRHASQEQKKHVVQTESTHAEDPKSSSRKQEKPRNGEESQNQFRESRQVQNLVINAGSDT